MPKYELLIWALKTTWLLFVFALGACVGSLINVIVYRMPRGISVIWPPSRCPSCNTRLTWRENIPILGWLLLGGRCRFCKQKISPEYPIVEAAVALLFALFYAVWYVIPDHAVWLGIDWGMVKPAWARNDPGQTWPTFLVLLTLLGSLVAMTLVDAKTFTIPLPIMWVPAIAALLVHPIHAAVVGRLPHVADSTKWIWAIPTPGTLDWPLIWASIGGVSGLGIANLLLMAGLIRPSFADYPEWEKSHIARGQEPSPPDTPAGEAGTPPEAVATPEVAPVAPEGNPALWMEYPHARREMLKELVFLAPCLGVGMAGWYFGQWYGGTHSSAPLWLTVLSGVLLGYLLGGGVVWAVRIFGSLGFGREAMGLGDVHLMAAIGAAVGWIDSILGFFGAAFVALFWAILGRLFSGVFNRMLPFGPYLAISTVLVLLCRPLIEMGLSAMFHQPIRIP